MRVVSVSRPGVSYAARECRLARMSVTLVVQHRENVKLSRAVRENSFVFESRGTVVFPVSVEVVVSNYRVQ